MPSKKPRIAVTMGDPCGVGPEIILKAFRDPGVRRACNPVVVGDAGVLDEVARRLGLKPLPASSVKSISALDIKSVGPGRPTKATGSAMISYIEEAVRMVESGEADAIATAPISKDAAKKAGFAFPGHTEFIAHLTGAKDFAMMLGGPSLKVVLVTIHEPVRKLARLVTTDRVLKTILVADRAFKECLGIKNPRIAVCGLNPHAGEGGMFGSEDEMATAPAVREARRRGVDAAGPLPADTVFYRAAVKKEFDCVIAMYHDQGLGPLKLLHFEDGINATLGLPIVRTSVDHGTAYDIAWKGEASHRSMVEAIVSAAGMAARDAGKRRRG